MKKAFFLFIGLFAFTLADAQITVSDDKIEAVITPEHSRSELWDVSVALREHGIEMRYDQIEWVSDQLVAINVRVKGENTGLKEYSTGDLVGDGQIKIVFRNNVDPESALCVSPSCE